jgi:hypothetical protein
MFESKAEGPLEDLLKNAPAMRDLLLMIEKYL